MAISGRRQYRTIKFIEFINPESELRQQLLSPMFKQIVTYGDQDFIYEFKQENVFNLSSEALSIAITNLTEYVFQLPIENFFVDPMNKKDLHVTCLVMVLEYATTLLDVDRDSFSIENSHKDAKTKQHACLNLACFVLGLRLVKEISEAKLSLPEISKEEAVADWMSITQYRSPITSLDKLRMSVHTGKHAADYFTLSERNKASTIPANNNSNPKLSSSPFEILCGSKYNLLASIVRRVAKKIILNAIRNNALYNEELILTEHMVIRKIIQNHQVGQFPPTFVHDFVNVLKLNYSFNFENQAVADLCAGYGGREVGFLALPEVKVYTGIDPNPGLTQAYFSIQQTYAIDKSVYIFPEKVEDVTVEKLKNPMSLTTSRGHLNLEYDLILTSPPYGVEWYFPGMGQYKQEPFLHALFAGLITKTQALRYGGIMGINFGVLGSLKKPVRHIPNEFVTFIQQHPELNNGELKLFPISPIRIQPEDPRAQGYALKEFLIVARREANLGVIPLLMPPPDDGALDGLPIPRVDGAGSQAAKRKYAELVVEETTASNKKPRLQIKFFHLPQEPSKETLEKAKVIRSQLKFD